MSYQPHQSEDVTLKPVAPSAPVYERDEGMSTTAERSIVRTFTRKGRTGYECTCGIEHLFPMYAVAQTAMGNALCHACECGRTNDIMPNGAVLLGRLPAQPTGGKEE